MKYRELNVRGILEVRFRSSYSTASGVTTKEVNKEEIDVYCVYCPQTDSCYYFNPKLFSKSISLRVDSPKNKQEKKVNFASDYRNSVKAPQAIWGAFSISFEILQFCKVTVR